MQLVIPTYENTRPDNKYSIYINDSSKSFGTSFQTPVPPQSGTLSKSESFLTMALDRAFLNVTLLGLAFMLVFTAFQTWNNIQTTIIDSIHQDDNSYNGNSYVSLAIIYAFLAVFNWTAPSVISVIGPKFSMITGAVTYLLFIASFSIPKEWLLYLTSAIIGIGAALIWTGQGNYLTLNSSGETISRNSGVFWAMLQMSMFIGNLFVYFVFRGKTHIDSSTRQLVVWTLSAIALLGLIVMVLFPRPPQRSIIIIDKDDEEEKEKSPTAPLNGPLEALKAAIKLAQTPNMLLLCVTFLYTGLELGFMSGVYGTSIGFTLNLNNSKQLLGLSGIATGFGEVLGGAAFGILGAKTIKWGRDPIVIAGFILHVASFFLIFVNLPNNAPFKETTDSAFITSNAILAIFCSFLLGLGDACFNTQIYSILGGVYVDDSASAFAIFKCVQSVGAAISFAYATKLVLYGQLGILLLFSILGAVTFVWVEWRHKRVVVTADSTLTINE